MKSVESELRKLEDNLICTINLRKASYVKLLTITKYFEQKNKKIEKPEQLLEWFIDDVHHDLKEDGKI